MERIQMSEYFRLDELLANYDHCYQPALAAQVGKQVERIDGFIE